MKELRVYVVNPCGHSRSDIKKLSIEEFAEIAENQGTVYSVKGFEKAVNSGELPNISDYFIRFATCEYGDVEEVKGKVFLD